MEFLPGIVVSAIVMLIILRWLKVRILGSSRTESGRNPMGNADDTLVGELKQRAESRRLRLKREGVTTGNLEDINPEFPIICPSCLRQNEQGLHYCVFCGIQLNSIRSEPISQDFDLSNGLALEMERDREVEYTQDGSEEIWLDIDQRLMVEDTQGLNSIPLADRQNFRKDPKSRPSTRPPFSFGSKPLNKLNTRTGLKHAVLLSEILGPPVSISRERFLDVSN